MSITDSNGNFSEDFLKRLEDLKKDQKENLRELERLRIDAYLENRNMPHQPIESRLDHNKTIQEMWSDFNLAETLERYPSQNGEIPVEIYAKSDFESDKKRLQEWRPRVTVPEPFSMTVREAERKPKGPKYTRASLEIDEARRQKEEEDKNMSKEFRSRPVPAHVYYPLYHDIVEHSDTRRKLTFEKRMRDLQEKSTAPSFVDRDHEKKREKAMAARELRDEEEAFLKTLASSFKASKPAPEVLAPKQSLVEFEAEREERIRARAQKLLQCSSLPPRMNSAPSPSARSRSASANEQRSNTRRHDKPVPDFQKLHRKNMRKLELAKKRSSPLSKRAEEKAQKKALVAGEEPDSKVFKATKINFSPEAPPIRANDSFTRRRDFVKHTLDLMDEELTRANENLLEKRRSQRLRAKVIRKSIPGKTNTSSSQKQTRQELKKNDLQRRIEYRKNLNKIYERVEARPCLFE
ncbi:unnamed protein product [Oikopleura dioica]|uniref:FAM161 centrosomal protein A n=1 Tax=Oikopleura dioica TaxID=34765 RepID=E4WUP3_OIKDI|nr:unnamed protein product [Oikopleura dioica]